MNHTETGTRGIPELAFSGSLDYYVNTMINNMIHNIVLKQ